MPVLSRQSRNVLFQKSPRRPASAGIGFSLAFFLAASRSRSAWVIGNCPLSTRQAGPRQQDISALPKSDIITLPQQVLPDGLQPSKSRGYTGCEQSFISIPRSSNGRTAAFGAVNRGSNPCRGATPIRINHLSLMFDELYRSSVQLRM